MDTAWHPVGGVDYPRTFPEFEAWFPDEAACRAYLARVRWRAGFRCPRSGSAEEPWLTGHGLLHCRRCHGQTSVTGGTVLERTRTSLRTWFLAIWFVTSQKHGVSALGLQRALGLGSYQTAWAWLHKLRRAMVRPSRDRLTGGVEVDKVYVGGPEEGVHGRQTEDKAIVAIAAEVRDRGIGRIRMKRVSDVSGDSLVPFVRESVMPGSPVHTDGWHGYDGLAQEGYIHTVTNIKRSGRPAHEMMPRVHRTAPLLKRWLIGTHQGGVQQHHLDYYLDEFTFRFNRRSSQARGLLFYRLVQQSAATSPAPYRSLVGGRPSRPQGVVST
jgi:transposase-like protein